MAEKNVINQMTIGKRSCWLYLLQSDLGDIYVVRHNDPTNKMAEDYLGWEADKAEKKFTQIAMKMIEGKA